MAKISVIYRAEQIVPEAIFEKFGHTAEYERRSAEISTRNNIAASGQDAYADAHEWAEDSSLVLVQRWAKEWETFIAELHGRLLAEKD